MAIADIQGKSMSAYLPPWCTQRDCDMAQPGYWDAPQQWHECDACQGEGFIARRVTVYEHGCGFPHDGTAEELCGKCNGACGWLDDAESDRGSI